MKNRKPSPTTGKVSAKPTEGASVNKNVRMEISVNETRKKSFYRQYKYLPVILERSEESGKGYW